MNFRVLDLTKILIPGGLVFFLLSVTILKVEDFIRISNLIKETLAIWVFIFFVLIYVIGYFVDMIGSWLEACVYRLYKKPSFLLLNDASKYVKLSRRNDIVDFLCFSMHRSSHNPFSKITATEVFKTANLLKDYCSSTTAKKRCFEYYYAMIFSRNLFTSFFVTFLIYLIQFYLQDLCFNFWSLILLLVFIITGFRWYRHAMYYSRQVFYMACEPVLK